MKNKRELFLLLPFALAYSISCSASALEPCRTPDDYDKAVDTIIDSAVGLPAELAITVLPSFEAEYGVRMIGQDVYFVQLRQSFWGRSVVADGPGRYHHDFRGIQVSTSTRKARLSPELAQRVRQKYARGLAAMKVSETGGLDGTTYRFLLRGVGCGETWSPQPNSTNGHLVEVAELLAKHARRSWLSSVRRSEEKISRALSVGQ